jgi:radical SAM protein (TIGR04043 family)
LKQNGEQICPVGVVDQPRFYSGQTEEGLPFWKIALLHGANCLASTVVQACLRQDAGEGCRFCGIGISLGLGNTIPVKRPEHLAQVAHAAVELDGIEHVVLTTGTTNYQDKGARYLARCASAIKKAVDVPIQAQCEPPEDLQDFEALRDAGVDSIGIHLESFDQAVRKRVAPGKARVGLDQYFQAFERAVDVFGPNQVSSFIIAGLGESPQSIIEGSRRLVQMGVYPLVLPLRSIPGSGMEEVSPPPWETMLPIYQEVSRALRAGGLSWQRSKAGCVRCGACSALPAFEESKRDSQ